MLPRVAKRFLGRMQPLFQGRNLLITNTLTGGVLMGLGDIIQQNWGHFQKPDRVWDWRMTGRMFTVGCSFGPLLQYWYIWLDGVFVGKVLKTVCIKVLVDQMVASPFLGIWYFVALALMEGQTLFEGWEDFKGKYWEIYKMELCVWPPVQMINFYFISPQYRVIFMNIVTLGWNIYMSNVRHRDDSPPTEQLSDSSAVDVQQEALPSTKPLEEKV